MRDECGNSYELSLVSSKCIGAYVRAKKNQNQVLAGGSWFHFSSLCFLMFITNKMHIFLLRRSAGFGRKSFHRKTHNSRDS